ncbi:hypothetical protein AURDEDRAFT_125962 [Auricularia subglabra TFB-10046 SS5]|nr:hypothetical protein AURDEDRAFT_125962 [Auricularia subglabra TFB-10046 SS5]
MSTSRPSRTARSPIPRVPVLPLAHQMPLTITGMPGGRARQDTSDLHEQVRFTPARQWVPGGSGTFGIQRRESPQSSYTPRELSPPRSPQLFPEGGLGERPNAPALSEFSASLEITPGSLETRVSTAKNSMDIDSIAPASDCDEEPTAILPALRTRTHASISGPVKSDKKDKVGPPTESEEKDKAAAVPPTESDETGVAIVFPTEFDDKDAEAVPPTESGAAAIVPSQPTESPQDAVPSLAAVGEVMPDSHVGTQTPIEEAAGRETLKMSTPGMRSFVVSFQESLRDWKRGKNLEEAAHIETKAIPLWTRVTTDNPHKVRWQDALRLYLGGGQEFEKRHKEQDELWKNLGKNLHKLPREDVAGVEKDVSLISDELKVIKAQHVSTSPICT